VRTASVSAADAQLDGLGPVHQQRGHRPPAGLRDAGPSPARRLADAHRRTPTVGIAQERDRTPLHEAERGAPRLDVLGQNERLADRVTGHQVPDPGEPGIALAAQDGVIDATEPGGGHQPRTAGHG
jgi:hypothetical protein